jgi:ribosome maturation factor RimP
LDGPPGPFFFAKSGLKAHLKLFCDQECFLDLEKIEAVIRPLIERSGYTLYDLEFSGRTLRISIEKPGGVNVDDCVETSRLLNPVLDVEDLVPGGRYELEVSSPGLNRALRRPEHFAAVIGETIHVTTKDFLSEWNGNEPFFMNRKNVTGVLKSFDGATIRMSVDGKDVMIPLGGIQKAQLEFHLKTTPKKGKRV